MCHKCWTVPCICNPDAVETLHHRRVLEEHYAALELMAYDPVVEAERYLRDAAIS